VLSLKPKISITVFIKSEKMPENFGGVEMPGFPYPGCGPDSTSSSVKPC